VIHIEPAYLNSEYTFETDNYAIDIRTNREDVYSNLRKAIEKMVVDCERELRFEALRRSACTHRGDS